MARKLSVSQINSYIKGVFLDELLLHDIDVYGEISEFKVSDNKTFLTLRENDCLMSCIKYSAHEPLPVGLKVLLHGTVSFYEKSGKVTFIVKNITAFGEGEHYLKLIKLKEKLKGEGLFDIYKPLPPYLKNVALITSHSGAVIHDYISVNNKRHNINTYVFDSKVQGENSDSEIIAMLNAANNYKVKFDCIIIARGGGATSELDVFNSEKLARCVASSPTPIISAIGHESDYTLCDLCASVRAGTPSIAAEIISSVNDVYLEKFYKIVSRLNESAYSLVNISKSRLIRLGSKISHNAELKTTLSKNEVKHLVKRLTLTSINLYNKNRQDLVNGVNKVNTATEKFIGVKDKNYFDTEVRLDKNSPLKILSKGYAKVSANGVDIKSVNEIKVDDNINIVMNDGKLLAKVTKRWQKNEL